jgi:hypothetical protein
VGSISNPTRNQELNGLDKMMFKIKQLTDVSGKILSDGLPFLTNKV